MISSQKSRKHLAAPSSWITVLLLVFSVVLNLVQAQRLRAYTNGQLEPVEAGTVLSRLDVVDLAGRAAEIRFDRPTILYYFSPTCGWCEKNWANVRSLFASTAGRFRFVGLSATKDVETFLHDRDLPFEAFSGVTPAMVRLLHLAGTPATIVVSAESKVLFAWSGAYIGPQQHEVERALGIVLPGIVSTGTPQ